MIDANTSLMRDPTASPLVGFLDGRTQGLRVLYLTMNRNLASTTVPTEGWFRLLPALGLKPVLVSRERGDFDAWARDQGIPTYQNPLPFPDKRRPWQFLKALWQLRSIARRHRIELIHCNEHDVYPIGQYLARTLGVPVVVSVHFTMARGYCNWAFSGRRVPSRMFFVSQRNSEYCHAGLDGIVPQSRCRVLHNGLNLSKYQPDANLRCDFRESHGLKDCLLLGVACALRERKQVEHLFDAVKDLSSERIRVVLAGGPVPGEEDGYADRLIELGRRLLGQRFVYLGHLDDLREMMNALDLFVNTSREESFGISVLEAMACGCPVVGYDSKAVDEVVLPHGGEITPQDDIECLKAAINRWIADPTKLAVARTNARRQAERFDIKYLSQRLWREYEEVLAETRREPAASAATATI